jgi:hypothetical protein
MLASWVTWGPIISGQLAFSIWLWLAVQLSSQCGWPLVQELDSIHLKQTALSHLWCTQLVKALKTLKWLRPITRKLIEIIWQLILWTKNISQDWTGLNEVTVMGHQDLHQLELCTPFEIETWTNFTVSLKDNLVITAASSLGPLNSL